MRILIFNELYSPLQKGGAEVSTQLLAESLCGLGHEVHVCTSSNRNYDEIINGIYVHRRIQHNLYWSYEKDNMPKRKKLCWHLKETYNIDNKLMISRLLDEVKPDILHTNVFTGFSVIIWQIAKKKQVPIVHTLRDYYLMCVRCTLFNHGSRCIKQCLLCKLTSVLKKKMSRNVDAIVGISRYILQKHLQEGYFKNAIEQAVIPNSVFSISSDKNIKREKVIGYLGRIHSSKGIELLIESFQKLGLTNYKLEIAGDGNNEYVNLLKMKYESENIKFIGRTDAVFFLSRIALLVVPSLWDEPFGRVIIEAHACGCPVFVSNRGGMPELINDTNGKVFKLERKDSLFKLLGQFVKGQLHFKFIHSSLEKYSTDIIAAEYLKLFYSLL